MNIKTICLAALASVFFSFGNAQSFQVPANVKLDVKEDYANYEKDVIAAAKWLEATPVSKETEKRQEINAFIVKWISGSPSVTIEIDKLQMDVLDKNPQLLAMYMAAYARHVLENNYTSDKVKATTAAFKSVINLYKLGGDFKRNKNLRKLIERDKEGKLEDWVIENIKS